MGWICMDLLKSMPVLGVQSLLSAAGGFRAELLGILSANSISLSAFREFREFWKDKGDRIEMDYSDYSDRLGMARYVVDVSCGRCACQSFQGLDQDRGRHLSAALLLAAKPQHKPCCGILAQHGKEFVWLVTSMSHPWTQIKRERDDLAG